MTKEQISKTKQRILGLHWDSNIKKAKARNLTLGLQKHRPSFRFTKKDYKQFFEARGINQKWV